MGMPVLPEGLGARGCSTGPVVGVTEGGVSAGRKEEDLWAKTLLSLRRNLARRFWNQTWTLASLKLVLLASSSLTKASG